MSGTSMDGINVALIETDGAAYIQEIDHMEISYDSSFKLLLKEAEYAVRKSLGDMKQAELYCPGLPDVIKYSTSLHGRAVLKLLSRTGYTASQIDIVGFHGQTLFHRPSQGISVVVGDGQALANQVKIKVVNDFRARDIAMGGQGAPFAPLYHYALARRDGKIPCAIINCGGIANITFIPDKNECHMIAFDTGPGNGLIDRWVRYYTQNREHMDKDGHYGAQGKVDEVTLRALYEKSILRENQNYLLMPPPKSLDVGDLNLIPELERLSFFDACRTLEAFTAETIIRSFDLVDGALLPPTWILAGGGWNNSIIRLEFDQRLTKKLGNKVEVLTADQVGWTTEGLEAQLFAYLAVRSLHHKFLSMPGATGVSKPISGGCLYVPEAPIGSIKQ